MANKTESMVSIEPSASCKRESSLIWLLCLMLLSFVLWAWHFQLDIASHASGRIIVDGQVKTIQHLEGGIVRRILVREGDVITKGQVLVELEGTASQADEQELSAMLASLEINVTSYRALLEGRETLAFPEVLEAQYPEQIRISKMLFKTQRDRLQFDLDQQALVILQREAEVRELEARKNRLADELKILNRQVAISNDLLGQGIVNEYDHLNLVMSQSKTKGDLVETGASIDRVRASLREANVEKRSLVEQFNQAIQEDLEEDQKRLNELRHRHEKFADSSQRTMIRSPVNGVVMTLQVVTEGGVIPPGGTLMTLVPEGDALMVEARLPVGDVGLIKVGQQARIRLIASAGRNFGAIPGEVTIVSADAVVPENGDPPFYRVRLRPLAEHFQSSSLVYPLIPGVHVDVAILTGHRTIMDYLMGPFTSALGLAMTEN